MRILISLLALAIAGATALSGDVTLRYKNEFKSTMPIPASVGQPANSVTYLKGSRGYTDSGTLSVFMDFEKQEVTMVNAAAKQFSTVPMKDYGANLAAAVPTVPEAARKLMDSMKMDVSSKATGRSETIAGLLADETEITIASTMDIPGLNANGQPFSRTVMQIWMARKEEAFRVPALRELMNHSLYSEYFMGSAGAMQKMLAGTPGVGKAIGPVMDELKKNQTIALRMHLSVYIPMLAMMPRAEGAPAMDPNAPVADMTMVATELSDAPLDDATFRIPGGLSQVPMADLMKSIMPASPPAKQ